MRALCLGFVLLYLALAATTLRTVAPSGDTVLVWADPVPHRIVLCVKGDGGGLVLATDPDEELERALDVALESNQVTLGGAGLGMVLSDHAYNSRLLLGPLDLPWMRNGYSSGVPDWIPRALAAGPLGWKAGMVFNILLGGLVLLLVLGIAGRLGGPWAVVVAGCLLAAEPQFHYYKKNLAGTEVWLQGLSVAVVALTWLAWRRGSWRPLAMAALLAGVGLHVKLSFGAVLVSLGLLGLILAAWRPLLAGRRWPRIVGGLGGLALLLAAGVAPTALHHQLRSTVEAPYVGSEQGQPNAAGALREIRGRLARLLSRAAGGEAGEGQGQGERTSPRGGKEQTFTGVLFAPARGLRRHFALRAAGSNEVASGRAKAEEPALPVMPAAARLGMPAAGLLLLLAIVGGARGWWAARGDGQRPMDARLIAWGGLLVLVLPLTVRLMQPDPHNMAMARPLLALGAGLGVAGVLGWPTGLAPRAGRRVLVVVGLLAGLTLLGRTVDLATLDRAQDEAVGRLIDVRNQRGLARSLDELESRHPAVLEHELMSIVEAHTHGRVRPVHYARSSLGSAGPGCVARQDPAWLDAILTAHVGSHLVLAWGPERSPGAAPTLLTPEEVRSAAARLGLGARPVRVLKDSRERWFATIWEISSAPVDGHTPAIRRP